MCVCDGVCVYGSLDVKGIGVGVLGGIGVGSIGVGVFGVWVSACVCVIGCVCVSAKR